MSEVSRSQQVQNAALQRSSAPNCKQIVGRVAIVTGVAMLALGLLAVAPLVSRFGSGVAIVAIAGSLASGVAMMSAGYALQQKGEKRESIDSSSIELSYKDLLELSLDSVEGVGITTPKPSITDDSFSELVKRIESDLAEAKLQASGLTTGEGEYPDLMAIHQKLVAARGQLNDSDTVRVRKIKQLERQLLDCVQQANSRESADRSVANATDRLEDAMKRVSELREAVQKELPLSLTEDEARYLRVEAESMILSSRTLAVLSQYHIDEAAKGMHRIAKETDYTLDSWTMQSFSNLEDFSEVRDAIFNERPDSQGAQELVAELNRKHTDLRELVGQAKSSVPKLLEAVALLRDYEALVREVAASGLSHEEAHRILHKEPKQDWGAGGHLVEIEALRIELMMSMNDHYLS